MKFELEVSRSGPEELGFSTTSNQTITAQFPLATGEIVLDNPLYIALGCPDCPRMQLHAQMMNKPIRIALISDNCKHPVVTTIDPKRSGFRLWCELLNPYSTAPELRSQKTPCEQKDKVTVCPV